VGPRDRSGHAKFLGVIYLRDINQRHVHYDYDRGYQQMPLSFVIFLYLHASSLHVSGLYQPIIRGILSCCLFVTTWFMECLAVCPRASRSRSRSVGCFLDLDARGQTAKHYMNQVVTNKQQLGIPLMMGW